MSTVRKVWSMLSREQHRVSMGLFGLMLVAMVLETLSTGAVIPALALMTQGDIGATYPKLAPLLQSLGNPSRERLVVGGMLVLVALYAIKTLFIGCLAWLQARFIAGLQASLSERLFAGYLRQPYAFHLERNSAQLLTYIGAASGLAGVVKVCLDLVAEMLVLLGITTLLLVVEPLGAISVVTAVGFAGWGFHRLTRKRVLLWGEARLFHDQRGLQHLQQGLGGAKDAKLLGREDNFVAQYRTHAVGSAQASQRQTTLQALPRLWLELLAVIGLAGLVVIMIGQHKPVAALLPTVGLFAAVAFRFMPSFNRVLGTVQGIRYLLPVIDVVYNEVRLIGEHRVAPKRPTLPFHGTLTLDRVSFKYRSADAPALRSVALTITCGTSVGFIGRSGAGKSTLVDVMLGLLTPQTGIVRVDGIDIQTNLRGWQDQIGYVPQSIFLTDDTLRRNIAFGLSNEHIDETALARAIRAAQLEEFVAELPQGLETVVGERGVRLSGGQRQRIGIARALYHDPAVLVLDEATSALDSDTERGLMQAVTAMRGTKTILIVAHRLSTVAYCDRLYRLDQGKVVEEPAPEEMHSYRRALSS